MEFKFTWYRCLNWRSLKLKEAREREGWEEDRGKVGSLGGELLKAGINHRNSHSQPLWAVSPFSFTLFHFPATSLIPCHCYFYISFPPLTLSLSLPILFQRFLGKSSVSTLVLKDSFLARETIQWVIDSKAQGNISERGERLGLILWKTVNELIETPNFQN